MKKAKKIFLPPQTDPSSHYTYQNSNTLKNKYGITDLKIFDERCSQDSEQAAIKLSKEPLPKQFDSNYLKYIHYNLFHKIFEWAGITRDIPFTFADGTTAFMPTMKKTSTDFGFSTSDQIQDSLKQLDKTLLEKNNLKGLSREDFVSEATELFSFLNYIHPFREGNGRAQRLFFERLAKAAGHKLNFSLVTKERIAFSSIIAVRDGDLTHIKQMLEDISNPEKVAGLKEAMNRMKNKEISDVSYCLFSTTNETIPYTDNDRDLDSDSFKIEMRKTSLAHQVHQPKPTQDKTLSFNEKLAFVDTQDLKETYIPKAEPASLTKSEILKKISQDPFIQANKEEVERLLYIVYGNAHILREKMTLINENPPLGKQIAEQIAQSPQSVSKLAGYNLCGIKTSMRRHARDNILLLSNALENYANAVQNIQRKIIDYHYIEQQRHKQTIESKKQIRKNFLDYSNVLLKEFNNL
ncbi:BID domain-containing T4SS effector [Bartonella sp. CB175]|uniref:BID domain-containing T4SS effector n=1 Tax=Bartonella sp. CB175 TaxID=3112256 RepID=UPI00300E6DEE